MGRPRKKRKYTRRKTAVTLRVDEHTLDQVAHAKRLITNIKTMLMDADPQVARTAISVLLRDLVMVNKIIGGLPPAP